ncbi:MAG: HNH endonuclease signature motif containing protein [Thermoleophilia bacterium]
MTARSHGSRASLSARIALLPDRHQEALDWFLLHQGTTTAWPRPLPDGTLLATKAKGIYKPAWSEYALSIRVMLGGPYPDGPITPADDGAWSLRYHQEREDSSSVYANDGLRFCARDGIPIGVLIQASARPTSTYEVLGLARITAVEGTFFLLEGLDPEEVIAPTPAAQRPVAPADVHPFDPDEVSDTRRRIIAGIIQRRGQARFRGQLVRAYDGACAMSGCGITEVLEAAHITPYLGPETNRPQNGLLLRADLHTLFDLGLIAIEPHTMKVHLAPTLRDSEYGRLAGIPLRLPREAWLAPSPEALRQHWERSTLAPLVAARRQG